MTFDFYKFFKDKVLQNISFNEELAVVDVYWYIIREMVKTNYGSSSRPQMTWFPPEMKMVRVIIGNAVNDGYFRYGQYLNIWRREK